MVIIFYWLQPIFSYCWNTIIISTFMLLKRNKLIVTCQDVFAKNKRLTFRDGKSYENLLIVILSTSFT